MGFFFCWFVSLKSALHYIVIIIIYACYAQNTYIYFFLYMILKIFPVFGRIIHVINFHLFFFLPNVLMFILFCPSNQSFRYVVICPIHVLVTGMCWWWIYGGGKLQECMGKVFRTAGHVNYTERKPRMTEGSVERNCVPVSLHGDVFC